MRGIDEVGAAAGSAMAALPLAFALLLPADYCAATIMGFISTPEALHQN